MRVIKIQLKETAGLIRISEPVRFSIPFPKGELITSQRLKLNRAGTVIDAQYQTLSTWPDGSIRWLQVSCLFSMNAHQEETLQLTMTEKSHTESDLMGSFTETAEHWRVQSKDLNYLLNKKNCSLIIQQQEQECQLQFELFFENGTKANFLPFPNKMRYTPGTVYSEFTLEGRWQGTAKLLNTSIILRVWHGVAILEVEACLHNPARATHKGGLWDLGDSGSVIFSAFNLALSSKNINKVVLKTTTAAKPIHIEPQQSFTLLQASSGKPNWSSKNHVNSNGKVDCAFQGYQVILDNKILTDGTQSHPEAHLSFGNLKCGVSQAEFWQNFPSSMAFNGQNFLLGLFPAVNDISYELQGGERKTQKFALNFGAGTLHWLQAPLLAKLPINQYQIAKAFPWFGPVNPTDPIRPLLKEALDGKANFFVKRDAIDEYGWRNYGDIFADHESLYLPVGQEPNISHYNNQYDAIFGFARQFALTGDQRWFQLMDELARHVTDIDIYHTEHDRVEYNNGLFWHTDHYLPAHTATHRTYSKHNQTSSVAGQTGGGPASEHCYTTGLKYHYWLTGNQNSKQAVIQLAEWMRALHGEAPGLLNQLWAIKKTELPALINMVKGNKYRLYPFTRGTGNYITALLDAFDLTLNRAYLQQCTEVIKQTISDTDDIDSRNLLNAEVAWSYTIMLAATARYLQLKSLLAEFDTDFHAVRQSFLAYCSWMRQHERLYLTAPEQLEYPNDTWLAQDIRKAMLMFQAAELCPEQTKEFTEKAQHWLKEVTSGLAQSKELHFARIQIILLQNFGPHSATETYLSTELRSRQIPNQPRSPLAAMTGRIGKKCLKGIMSCRIRHELSWLKARMKS